MTRLSGVEGLIRSTGGDKNHEEAMDQPNKKEAS
jgi:hypothetical protein